MISPNDIEATIGFLVPGFVAIKVFSFFGLRSNRTDLDLTIWSLVASVAIARLADRIVPAAGTMGAILIGVAVAGVAAYMWKRDLASPLRTATAPRARDAILRAAWVQVAVSNGDVLSGRLRVAAEPTSDDQDLYIDRPAWVVGGRAQEMDGTAGVIVPGASIAYIQMLGAPAAEPALSG